MLIGKTCLGIVVVLAPNRKRNIRGDSATLPSASSVSLLKKRSAGVLDISMPPPTCPGCRVESAGTL